MKTIEKLGLGLLLVSSINYSEEIKGTVFLETSALRLKDHYIGENLKNSAPEISKKKWCNIWENSNPILNTNYFNQNKILNVHPSAVGILGKGPKVKVFNNGTINVHESNTKGIQVGNGYGENKGDINVLGNLNGGMVVDKGGAIVNSGNVFVGQSNNIGMIVKGANSKGINDGMISLSGEHSIGIESISKDSIGINRGGIILNSNSPNSFGLVTFGGEVINDGHILIKNSNNVYTTGMQAVAGNGINNGLIILTNSNQTAMDSAYNGSVINNGKIWTNNITGNCFGMTVKSNSYGINKKNITINGVGIGMTSEVTGDSNVNLLNEGDIILDTNNSIGMNVASKSFITNKGTISIEGNENIGLMGNNHSIIKTTKNSNINIKGDKNKGLALVNSEFINHGNITINGNNNKGIELLNNSKGVNKGVININSGSGNSGIYLDKTSEFLNQGTIIIKNQTLDESKMKKEINNNIGINSQGIFEMDKNSSLIAKKITGNIYFSPKITTGNLKDEYSLKNIFKTEKMEGNLIVRSPLFKAKLIPTNSSLYNVNLERVNFNKVIDNKNIGNYLEKNYKNKKFNTLAKIRLYDSFKLSSTKERVNKLSSDLFGTKFFPTLEKQTFTFLRFNNEILRSNVSKQSLKENFRYIIGGTYNVIKQNSSDYIANYSTNLENIWLGGERKITKNSKIGIVLGVGEYNTNFTENSDKKDKLLQGTIFLNLNKFTMNFNSFFTFGQLKSKLSRYSFTQEEYLNSKYNNNFYIISNEISKNFNFNNTITITPQIALNFYRISQDKINETTGKYPIETGKSKRNILEPKIGITFGKKINLTNNYILNTQISTNYFWRTKTGNKYIKEKIKYLNEGYCDLKKDSIQKNGGTLKIKLSLEKNNWDVYTYYKMNFENKNDNLCGVGLIYKLGGN